MHQSNQPKTTSNSLNRDAAVQISEEGEDAKKHCINNELFHVKQGEGEPSKGELIRNGLGKEMREDYPDADFETITNYAYGSLSAICGLLTGTNRDGREWAKKEIRRLVKLGKGE